MKIVVFLFVLVILPVSCKKDNSYLYPRYEAVSGTWNLNSVSYDSSGVKIKKAIPFDKLVIYNDLDYLIFMNKTTLVENGKISIITQTDDKLILYFVPDYPSYSSFAGSHIFGITHVELVSISDNEMIIKTINAGYAEYSDRVITFRR